MIFNVTGGGGGSGATLTVTAQAGCTVTVSKDGKTKTKIAGADGTAVFKGLETGTWTVTITDGGQQASKNVTVTADYETAITFFSATINVTYPAGSICTATDGVTTLAAPDTSGIWECHVPNTGAWTVSLSNGFHEQVTITESGDEKTVDKWHLYNAGDERAYITGGIKSVSMVYQDNGIGSAYAMGTVTKNTDNIYLYGGTDARQMCIATANKVDTAGFKLLRARVSDVKVISSAFHRLGLYSGYNASTKEVAMASYNTAGVVSVDISNVTYPNYVALCLNSSSGISAYTTVHEIWLE